MRSDLFKMKEKAEYKTAIAAPALCMALLLGFPAAAQPAVIDGTTGQRTETIRPQTGSENGAVATQQKLAHKEVAFLKQAAENNHAEIESSRLAVQKSSDNRIKTFAQQMIEDHGKTAEELNRLAAAKGVDLPEGPSVLQKAKIKLLGSAEGSNFDRLYSENMGITAHRETLELFQKAMDNVKDGEVRDFVAKTLPTLRHHLEMARQLPGNSPGNGKRR